MTETPPTIAVCVRTRFGDQPSCGGRGSDEIATALEKAVAARGWAPQVVEPVQCLAACNDGPNVRFIPGGRFHHNVALADVPAIIADFELFCAERGLTPSSAPSAAPAGGVPIPGA